MRLYSLQEIKALLEQAGLKILQIYGDYNNGEFDISSPYMIIECRLDWKEVSEMKEQGLIIICAE